MKPHHKKILDTANIYYADLKFKAAGVDPSYIAPELFPTIQSNQIKAALFTIADLLQPDGPSKEYTRINDVYSEDDIPLGWCTRIIGRKKGTVKIRRVKPGGEEFIIESGTLTATPEEDLIVIPTNKDPEYPCKQKIFDKTYECLPGTPTIFRKRTENVFYQIPEGFVVNVHTLEGILKDVKYPDCIAVGEEGEVWVNSKEWIERNIEILSID